MVDKKPDFEVKWHGENIRRPPTSGNIRKILCKRGRVQADEKLLTTCILYFKSIRIGQSDDIKCEFVEAAVLRKIIELLDKWWIQCTWEELKKIACALRMLSVRPYSVAEGKPHVDINIVPHWLNTSLMSDIRVSVDIFTMGSKRELLAEMSGRFEELLQYEPRDRLNVPFVTDRELRWIVDTIHQRVIPVCTWTELDSAFSEFEEYCYRLENFRIRQPSTEQYLQPYSERSTTQSRQQPNFGVMVDKKPDFRVKWHGENIRRPHLSGNTRKIKCKDEVVDIDENYIRKCMIYFSEIPSEQSDVPLEYDLVEAAVMRKIIELIGNGNIQCTWEELKKIAYALKNLSVHPYNVAEANLHVEIYIVPHWCVTSRPNDITVSVGNLALISNRELLAEMSGRFEELLQYERNDTLQVPFVTFNDLSWIVNTIHQRGVTVNTWKDLLWSEFEEYCYRLENFRIRQPSSERTRTSSERTRTSSEQSRSSSSEQSRSSSSEQSRSSSSEQSRSSSSEQSRSSSSEQSRSSSSEQSRTSSSEQSRPPHREQYGQPSSERTRASSEQSRQPHKEQHGEPSSEGTRTSSGEQSILPHREQYGQPSSEGTRTSSGEQSILPHREQYGEPSSERTRTSSEQSRPPSSGRTRTSSEHSRQPHKEQYGQPFSERTRTSSSERFRQPSSEQSRPPYREQSRPLYREQYAQPSSGRTRTSSEQSRQPHKEQHGQPSSEGTRTSGEQSILPHREQYGQPSSERTRTSSEQSRPPSSGRTRTSSEHSRQPHKEQHGKPSSEGTRTSSCEQSILPHREQYGQPSSERTRTSSEQSRPPSSGRTRTSSEQSRQPHKEQHGQPSSEGTRTSSGEQFILPHREQYGQLSSERTRTSSSERFRQPSSEQSRPPYREQSRPPYREQYGQQSSEQTITPYREQYGEPSNEQYGQPSSDRFKQPSREQSSPQSRQQITKNDTPEQFPTTSTVEVLPIAGPSWKYETSTRCESSNSAGYFSEGIGLTENVTSPESGVLPVAGRSQTAGTVGTAHRTLEVPQDYQIKLVPLQEAFHRLRPGGHVLCLTEQEAMALLNSEGRVRIEYLGASASIDLDQQETSLPLVDECSTKAGTQDKSERSSVKEELLAKSADQSRKSAGSSPKSVPRKQKSKKNGSYADEDFSKETSGVAQETSPKEFLTSAFTQPSTSRETTDLLTVPRPTLQGEISGVEEHEIRKFIVPRKQKSKKHGSYADENFSKETSGVAQETLHKEFPTSAILQPSTSRGTGVLLKVPSPVPLAELFDDDEYEIREVDVTKNDTREQFPKTRTVEVLPKAGPSLSECIGFSEDFTSQESCVLPVGGSLQTAGTVGTAHRTLEVPQNYQIIVDPPPEAFHHLRPGDHVVRLTEEEAMALLNPEGRVRIEFLGVSKTIYLDQQEMTLHLVDECSTEAGTQKKAEPSSAKEDLSAKSADQSRKSAGSSPKSPGPSPKGASPFPKND